MKTLSRVFSTLMVLTLLLFTAANAQSSEQDLYAPFNSDFGPIPLQAVYSVDLYSDGVLSETTYVVQVDLFVPVAFLSGIEDLHAGLSGMFYLVSMNGFFYVEDFTIGEEQSGNVIVSLFFFLPKDSELTDYRLAYNGQLRMLAESGDQPEQTADTNETAPPDGIGADEAVVSDLSASEAEDVVSEDEDSSLDTLSAILDALGEPLYQTTYDDLAKGNVIQKDDRSSNARGLQTLLIAFGYDVTADGLADSKTFNPLHQLQAVFGLEMTNSIDANGFSFLLTCLYIMNDQDNAEELLVGAELTYSEFDYLLGCCAELKGLYYTAYGHFDYSSEEDAYDRAQACIRLWPDNGELYHNKNFISSQTQLHIKVDNQDEGYATYIKIYSETGDWVCSLFVNSSGTVTTNLPGGVYTIKLGTGENWFGLQEAFGDEGYYETLLFDGDMAEVSLQSGYDYTLTINTSANDPEADDVNSEYTDFGDF